MRTQVRGCGAASHRAPGGWRPGWMRLASLCRGAQLALPTPLRSNPTRCTPLPTATSGPCAAVPTLLLSIAASSPSSDIVIAIKIGA